MSVVERMRPLGAGQLSNHYHRPACELHLTYPPALYEYPVPEDVLLSLSSNWTATKARMAAERPRTWVGRISRLLFHRPTGMVSFANLAKLASFETWLKHQPFGVVVGVRRSSYQHPFAYYVQQNGFPKARAVQFHMEIHLTDGQGGVYDLPYSLLHLDKHLRSGSSDPADPALSREDCLDACKFVREGGWH